MARGQHKKRGPFIAKLLPGAVSLVLFASSSSAEVSTYGEAIAYAMQTNPTVVASYYRFEEAREAQRASEGRMYPSVDLEADWGWEDRATPVVDFGEYEKDSVRLSITQLLFDGFQTRDEARSRGYEKLAAYYDMHDAAQDIALEATVAYAEAVLYQDLVGYAEENYLIHRDVLNKIAERVAAGRDEGVNLEQATARMALAESNLLTEVTNLHDTRAEFQRVTGQLPIDALPMPLLPTGLMPQLRDEAINLAYQRNPRINRTIEEMRAAREFLNSTRGPMYPRFDLRYRNQQETNVNGFQGDYDLQSVELVMTYNLFRGGSDRATRRRWANNYYETLETRKDACLDVRRQVTIAFNNMRALGKQIEYLNVQLASQDRARKAYTDQFDRNQRTLLDLLDSINELFDTQRALAFAEVELIKAQATVLAEMGVLTDSLDARGFNADKVAELELELGRQEDENIPTCSPEVLPEIAIDTEAVFNKPNPIYSDDPMIDQTISQPEEAPSGW